MTTRDASNTPRARRILRTALAALAGATASGWALAAQAQTPPVVGYLHSGSPRVLTHLEFVRGLSQTGYVDGKNVVIDFRWAEGRYDRLPAMAAELVRRPVALLGAFGGVHTAIAAKAATSSIPILFANGSDPVKFGLVASLNRPGGNVTGISFFTAELEAKRLGLLHELVPAGITIAALVNSANANAKNQTKEVEEAARTLGRRVHVLYAREEGEFVGVFARLKQLNASALLVTADPYFYSHHRKIVALAAEHRVAAIYEWREFVEVGGLASYGTKLKDAYYQAGVYAGRLLKGERPAELPVMQAVSFEFVINLRAAKALGLAMPPTLLARADEVIE